MVREACQRLSKNRGDGVSIGRSNGLEMNDAYFGAAAALARHQQADSPSHERRAREEIDESLQKELWLLRKSTR